METILLTFIFNFYSNNKIFQNFHKSNYCLFLSNNWYIILLILKFFLNKALFVILIN